MNEVVILVLFAFLVALPFIPGIISLQKKKDTEPLKVDPHYSRDPQYFGQSLRQNLQSSPRVAYHETLNLNDHSSTPQIIASQVQGNENLQLDELYLIHGGSLGSKIKAKAICADDDLMIGQYLHIQKYIDVQGSLTLEAHSNLGISAAASGQLHLQANTQFQRLYGKPIIVHGLAPHIIEPTPSLGDDFVWAHNALRIPQHHVLSHGIVCHGELYLGKESVVQGDLKVYGDLVMYKGAKVNGNIVVRGSIIMYGENIVRGHIHTEKDLIIGPRGSLGRTDVQLSIYAAGKITLLPEVTILGYVVADRGGHVTEDHPLLNNQIIATMVHRLMR